MGAPALWFWGGSAAGAPPGGGAFGPAETSCIGTTSFADAAEETPAAELTDCEPPQNAARLLDRRMLCAARSRSFWSSVARRLFRGALSFDPAGRPTGGMATTATNQARSTTRAGPIRQ